MDDAREDVRASVYQTIQEYGVHDDDLEDALLIGFLAVAEWQTPDGGRWLSQISGDHARPLTSWRLRGYAAEILHDPNFAEGRE